MKYKIFFANYCEDEHLPSEEAELRDVDLILDSMDYILHMPDNFLGITDLNDTTIQFMVNKDKTIHVEIPKPQDQGSYTMNLNLQDCLKLVKGLDGQIDIQKYPEFIFESWF
jgi:hypothetical protein